MDDTPIDPSTAMGELADVTQLPLPELFASDDSVLGHALRRVLADLDRPQQIIAAFGNCP